jgi:hypothetical protein
VNFQIFKFDNKNPDQIGEFILQIKIANSVGDNFKTTIDPDY